MRLDIYPLVETSDTILSTMYVNDGHPLCYVLEDSPRLANGATKQPGHTAIPAGAYEVAITHSPRFGRLLPILLNVPGFAGIRMHAGETVEHTDGCLLLGLEYVTDQDYVNMRTVYKLRRSGEALLKAMRTMQAALDAGDDRILLTIHEH